MLVKSRITFSMTPYTKSVTKKTTDKILTKSKVSIWKFLCVSLFACARSSAQRWSIFPAFSNPRFPVFCPWNPFGSTPHPYCLPSLGQTGDKIQFLCENSFIYCPRAFGRLEPNNHSRFRLLNDSVRSRLYFYDLYYLFETWRWFELFKNSSRCRWWRTLSFYKIRFDTFIMRIIII